MLMMISVANNLNCFYMHTIFGQKYTKPAIVIKCKKLFWKTFWKI